MNCSTVARRLSKVEEALGATLFDRRRTGYVATAHGRELISLAGRVEADVVSVARRVSEQGRRHAGELRITTSDSILLYFLAPLIASFQARNPAIKIEVIVGNVPLNLARGEADIAVRATENPPENLFGRKVATIAWAVYAPISNPGSRWPGSGLFERQWVSYCGELSGLKAAALVERRVRPDNIAFQTDSVAGAAAAIGAGLGLGYLPCMLGDVSPGLFRIGPIEPRLNDELWLLTHPDIRNSDRIQGFMAHCIHMIGQNRSLIEGDCGSNTGAPRFAELAFLPSMPMEAALP